MLLFKRLVDETQMPQSQNFRTAFKQILACIFLSVSQLKPNSCMYPLSERFVIIFFYSTAPRARRAQSSKKLMTNIVELLLLKSF